MAIRLAIRRCGAVPRRTLAQPSTSQTRFPMDQLRNSSSSSNTTPTITLTPDVPTSKRTGRTTGRRKRDRYLPQKDQPVIAPLSKVSSFPSLLSPDPILDTYSSTTRIANRGTNFQATVNLFPFAPFGSPEGQEEELPAPDATLRTDNEGEEGSSSSGETSSSRFPDRFANLPYSSKFLSSLYRFPLIRKRVVQQTSKGKIPRMFALVVVGNGDGLVGFGQGKDEGTPKAMDKAFSAAVKRLDYVDRFEDRTIWTTMEMKLGATRVVMRPRPVGFGLMVNPYVHQVCKAAGIRDLSAKVYGSRNGMQIVKAVMMMLQGGSTPLGMGDGIGGKGKREEAKEGMRGREVVERERGRRLVEGTGWL